MRPHIRRGVGILYIPVLLLIIGFAINAVSSNALAQPQFLEEMVPMRDGVRLHTFIYLPDPKVWSPPYPVIVQRMPYGIGKAGILPGPDIPSAAILRGWKAGIGRGYACVFQDTRGRFASEGVDRVYYDEDLDGYDIIEWAAKQRWCNGKVGMAGSSAAGVTSYAAASQKPPHLKTIFAQVGSANIYNEVVYEGQALEMERLMLWLPGNIPGLSSSHINSLKLSEGQIQEAKNLTQQINNDLKSHMLDSATSKWWMYLPLINYPGFSQLQPFWNEIMSHPTQDEFRDKHNFRETIQVPSVHVSTWHDISLESIIKSYKVLQERVGQQKLFIGPGHHYTVYEPNFWPYDPFFSWFDYWLKGINTTIMDGPPIYYYHIGDDKWRYAEQWPPPGVESTNYYFHTDGALNTNRPSGEEASKSYVYDPKNPVQTYGGRNLSIAKGSLDQRPAKANRQDVLVYKTEVLAKDLEIAGKAEIILHGSSNCKDTDFIAKLIDVHPDGKAMLVLDGVIRALYRESPKKPVPMEPNTIYAFTISLGHMSHVFKAEHQIEVNISSSNFPRRARNTNSGNPLYTADSEKDMIEATNTVYHASQYPSYLILPVLPPQKSNSFAGTANFKLGQSSYKGPAELYVFQEKVYLKYGDRWLNWKTTKTAREGRYDARGKAGNISVLVQAKDQTTADVLATGAGLYFKGWAK